MSTIKAMVMHSNRALKVIAIILVCAALYRAHAAFIPVALALLLSLILSGPVELLHKKGVPRSLSATLILLLVLLALGGVATGIAGPAQQWFTNAPQTLVTVKRKIRPIARFMTQLDEFTKSATSLASATHSSPSIAAAADDTSPTRLLGATGSAAAAGLTFMIVTLFLLSGGPPMMARMGAAFSDSVHASHVLGLLERVRAEVGHYYLVTTLINAALGLLTGSALWAWGMPTPYLWGAMAAIFNYVPYAGPAATLLIVSVVAIVSFDALGPVLGVGGSFLLLTTLEGQIVQPLLVGRRMEVNPLLVFLGLWFGGLFWGVAGIILATPALVALKVIAENSKGGRPLLEFLGPNRESTKPAGGIRRLVRRK